MRINSASPFPMICRLWIREPYRANACRGRGEWLHVDAPDELMDALYIPSGFRPTPQA